MFSEIPRVLNTFYIVTLKFVLLYLSTDAFGREGHSAAWVRLQGRSWVRAQALSVVRGLPLPQREACDPAWFIMVFTRSTLRKKTT